MILKLKPATKDYIWGGTTLKNEWGKLSDTQKIAECWEFSLYPSSESRIVGGEFDGLTLAELREKKPELFGVNCEKFASFPMLIKLIDACDNLSVQVHPNDEYALKNENSLGKTEIWYIADAKEGAQIYYGLNSDLTREAFVQSIKDNTITDKLNAVKVKKGDFFFVEAGTMHALGAGVIVLEVQENSNLTYRVYDYGRRDAMGRQRELHVEKAIDVTTLAKQEIPCQEKCYLAHQGAKVRTLACTDYFNTEEVVIEDCYEIYCESSFVTFTVVDGQGRMGEFALNKGDTYMLPAKTKEKIYADKALTIIKTNL